MASSGDLLADRRYVYAEAALDEGDHAAASDLARQALELAPRYAPAWFLLGRALAAEAVLAPPGETAAATADAVSAFRQALIHDPDDRLGSRIRLAELGAADPFAAISPGYVRELFDDYAVRFDRHLRRGLNYRAPELLRDAVRRACSLRLTQCRFETMLDLGCGTGLAAEAFRDVCGSMAGVDLSPGMLRKAEEKALYASLDCGELTAWLAARPDDSAGLILAADVFVYLADLAPVFAGAASVLTPGGLFAFTVQAHDGEGVVLGEDGRFAHAESHLRDLAARARLVPLVLEAAVTRLDRGRNVPGLVAILGR